MLQTFIVSDLDQCRELWTALLPRETLTDLWEVRSCFQRHFQRPTAFVVCEDQGQLKGLLPLSWLEESDKNNGIRSDHPFFRILSGNVIGFGFG